MVGVHTGMLRMHAPRARPFRMSLRVFVSELSFQYPHHHAILGTAHRHLRSRAQKHQTVDPRLDLHPALLLLVVPFAALAGVLEAIHAAVWVAVWVVVGAHLFDQPVALWSDDFPEQLTVYRSHPTLPLDGFPESWSPDKFFLRSTLTVASKTIREPR